MRSSVCARGAVNQCRRLPADLRKAQCHHPWRKLLDSSGCWVIFALLVLVKPYKSFEGKHLDNLEA